MPSSLKTVLSATLALLATVGLSLAALRRGAAESANPPPAKSSPPFAVRELYAVGHFGNSYEVMGEYEMRRYLAEAKRWGFNRYADWFDMEDCSDPFAEKGLVLLSHAMWERKKQNFRSAQALGLSCDLVITPNHVYVDQCRPALLAKKGPKIFGQLICPSQPEARAMILKNYENLFADLARAGVRLRAINSCPYDFGGCACEKCRPWILTFAKLMREIHAIAERYHFGIENHMIGWWWTPEEHRLLADWADREAPGWIKSMSLHIPYSATTVAGVRLPKGCQRWAFVHIGYADQANPRDIYGHFGPVAAPLRLPETVEHLAASGVTGVMAYSEGMFDDVNKALLAGLGSGQFRTGDEVLRAYATRYFGADRQQAAPWAQWLTAWGRPFDADPEQMAQQLARLKQPGASGWRERQWELKLELFRLNKRIMAETGWTPARLDAVDHFWQVQEEIYRGLWGLTLLRHVFARCYTPAPWYADWAKHASTHAKSLGKNQ
jgi:hypothetical protein